MPCHPPHPSPNTPDLAPNKQPMLQVVISLSESSSGKLQEQKNQAQAGDASRAHLGSYCCCWNLTQAKLFLRGSCHMKGASQHLVHPRIRPSSSQPPRAGESPQGLTEQRRVRKNRGGGMGRGREERGALWLSFMINPTRNTFCAWGRAWTQLRLPHTARVPSPSQGTGLPCPLVTLGGGSSGFS